jgi:NitT/TauT family transport system substrate-binding protein
MPQREHPASSGCLSRRRVLALLPAVAVGCSGHKHPLAVGISAFPPFELATLARESGYFRDAGLDARLVEFQDLSDAQRAFEQGKLDGLATTLVEVLVTRNAGARDLRVMRAISVSEGADVILAPREIRAVADLRGRKVAVEIASLSHFMLARALQRAGIALSDVTPVSMAQHAMPAALLSGEVSAIVTYPPVATLLRADPRWHVLFSSRAIPDEVVDVYAFDAQAIARRPHDIQAFFQALDRAFHRFAAEPQDSCRIMAPRLRMTADAACAALTDGIRLVAPSEQARYLGPTMAMRTSIAAVQRALAESRLVGTDPALADCLEPLRP